MSRAETFLRGGTPSTEVPELVEALSAASQPYTHWRFVAYYPQRWLHDAIENRITAPLFFLVFARTDGSPSPPPPSVSADASSLGVSAAGSAAAEKTTEPTVEQQEDSAAWHLLCHTVLPNGAIPTESRQSGEHADGVTVGGGGIGALRTLLCAVPAALHPSASVEWLTVVDGIAYRRMGLMSEAVFASTLTPAIAKVLEKCWRAHPNTATAASAHFVQDGRCVTTVDFSRPAADAAFEVATSAQSSKAAQDFTAAVVRPAVEWMSTCRSMASFVADASVPALSEEARQLLFPAMAAISPRLFSSLFVEAAHADAAPPAPLPDPETLTGLARLRAERDVGIAQWKRTVGEYASFTVVSTVTTTNTTAAVAAAAAGAAPPLPPSTTTTATTAAASSSSAVSTGRSFQHAILLQRPIEEKKPVDVDNRDPGPLAPQPIGAELHLFQDRGDVLYALDQMGNRSNIHFRFADTLPDDGEVLVQLSPVEGTPFCDLEAYFCALPETAAVFTAGVASQCAESCCPVVVPRVLYRRPTGGVQKANPIATAQTEMEVLSPTTDMVRAAVAALQYLSTHAECTEGTGVAQAAAAAAAGARVVAPQPGYTLRVPPVDVSAVPMKTCGWCGRRREVLLRCGGCKAVSYCCKRHQALDWKDGTHKVECKLWRHARELHEHVGAPWAARTSQVWTPPAVEGEATSDGHEPCRKGRGWSCATTLVQFLRDTRAQRLAQKGAAGLQYIHVAGFDASCAEDFVRAAADQLRTFGAEEPQYRILVCADTFADAQRNAVWGIRRGGGSGSDASAAWLTPSTGVLGDAWHCGGASAEAATAPAICAALIRFCCVKYHNVDRAALSREPEKDQRPSAVLSFGPLNGDGCTYLTAALEVFAAHDVGVVPLRLVDSSYVGAVRSRDAMASRVSSSDACGATVKARVAELVASAKRAEAAEVTAAAAPACTTSAGHRRPLQIMFNDVGAAAVEVTTQKPAVHGFGETTATSVECPVEESQAGGALPRYVNAFLFDLFPTDI